MDIRLKILFSNDKFGRGFEIINPPVLPRDGEVLQFEWEDYLTNKDKIKLIRDFLEDDTFLARIVTKNYSQKGVEIIVLLMSENEYEEDEARKKSRIYGKIMRP